MATEPNGRKPVGWPSRLTKARLHVVTGKGGTGKTTVAAALALALAAGGRKVLLVEVEGRQGIAQLFDVPPLPYEEAKIAAADGGGEVNALAIDLEEALLEYLEMFYNLGLAGRALRRIGAIDFATTIAPGLRDVLLTGKVKEIVTRAEKRQAAPVVRRGRGRRAADRPHRPLPRRHQGGRRSWPRSARCTPRPTAWSRCCTPTATAVHLVTLLEEMPVQETPTRSTSCRSSGCRSAA